MIIEALKVKAVLGKLHLRIFHDFEAANLELLALGFGFFELIAFEGAPVVHSPLHHA
jgi:hypothetical protein